MFPLPFTVSAVILMIAFVISKMQYSSSRISIAAHALLGPLETATLVYAFVTYVGRDQTSFITFLLFLFSICLIGSFNLFSLVIQTPILRGDVKFLRWMRRRQVRSDFHFNGIWFWLMTGLSVVCSFKLKYLLFSGLFNLDCLKGQLQSVQKFKMFNVFSFFGLVPEILTLYCAVVTIVQLDSSDGLFMLLLDTIVIFLLNMVFSILAASKDQDFFKEEIDGIVINKKYQVGESEFYSCNQIGTKSSLAGKELEDIIELDEEAYASTKREKKANRVKGGGQPQKISECTEQQNTVTASKRNSDEEMVDNEYKSQVVPQNEIHNVLMIDDVYDFDEQSAPKEEIVEDECQREVALVQKCLQLQPQQIDKQRTEQVSCSQQVESKCEQEISKQKSERVNLTEYLLSMEKSKSNVQNSLKYDKKITVDLQTQFSGELESRLNKLSRIQIQPKIDVNKAFQEQSGQQASSSTIIQGVLSTRSKGLKRFKTDPVRGGEKQKGDPNHFDCNTLNSIVQKVLESHQTPSKDIKEKTRQLRHQIETGGISFNEDHDEKPIRNKSREKLSTFQNHPIHNHSPSHPMKNQQNSSKIKAYEEYDREFQMCQPYLRRRVKTEKGNIRSEMKSQRDIQMDKFEKKQLLDQQQMNKLIKIHAEAANYEANEKQIKQFKRSEQQNASVFPPKMPQDVKQHSIISADRAPRKPTTCIKLKLDSKSKNNQSASGILRGVKWKESLQHCRRASSRSAQKYRKRSNSYLSSGMNIGDKNKIRSLQKIYLEKKAN